MKLEYADRGARFLAFLIDAVLLGIVGGVVGGVLGAITGGGNTGSAFSNLVGLVLGIGYYVFYQEKYGQTIGKKAMGMKVVTEDGKTPDKVTFLLREIVGKFISAIILMIGFFMILWDPKRQGLHDKLAKTYVVKVSK